MTELRARQLHLVNRPAGLPAHTDFKLVTVDMAPPQSGEVLVKNLYMSVDPYMRGRMRAVGVYAEPYALNQPMYGGAIGEVIDSEDPGFRTGDIVLNQGAWQDQLVAKAASLTKITPFDHSRLSLYLGTLGMPGFTSYVGLLRFGEPKVGETVFVSAASGAVGANVCQIAKLKGCRVVGSVGSDAKADWLRKECGVDAVINYKTCGDLTTALSAAAPQGVDVYFENVGGEHLQAALNVMNPFGRIAACGMIASYNNAQPTPGPNNLMLIVGKKIRINGFIVWDHADMHADFMRDMMSWIKQGQIVTHETVVTGLENAVDAFLGLFTGDNFGKMVVKL